MKHISAINIFRDFLFIVPALLILSCREYSDNTDEPFSLHEGIDHARGFTVKEYDNYTLLNVYNPWQGASDILFSYILTANDKEISGSLPEGTVIQTPVRSVICLSTTHVAMLDFINETEKITAVSGREYIYNQDVRNRLERGEIHDIGYDMNLDYERILELNPDIILAYGVDAEAHAWLGKLRKLGVKVVMIGEYLENSPLAQAEWVKFIAHLFDKQDFTEEKFSVVENQYRQLADMAPEAESRPVVMSGLPWRSSWFVPGGKSHFATLISDAGGRYLWDNNEGRENFPVDIESAIDRGSEADYWINAGTALSMDDIVNTDKRLVNMKPFRLNRVFNNNARLNNRSGNDYWESGIVNPHLVLRDIIHILHPDILPGHEPVYFRKL